MVHPHYNTRSFDPCRQDLWVAIHSRSSLAAFDGQCGVSLRGFALRLLFWLRLEITDL